MQSANPQSNAVALQTTLACLLETVSSKGYWIDPLEDWEPILACVAVEVLLDAGLRPDHVWANRDLHRMTLETPLRWLNSRILADGSFGTDFWESCRLGSLIERHSLKAYFPNYGELQNYILRLHDSDGLLTGTSDWLGPGFLTAATDYLDLIGKHADAGVLVTRLLSSQENDGRWSGVVGAIGHPLVSPFWHTAQVILTLARKSKTEHRAPINRAIEFLKRTQDQSGKWQDTQQFVIYSTCYAILALEHAEVRDQAAINRGVEFLKSNMKSDGRQYDFGGTLMAALALLSVAKYTFESELSIVDHVISRIATCQIDAAHKGEAAAQALSDKLRVRNEELEKKFGNADIAFTKKQFWLVGLIVTLIIPTMSALAGKVIGKVGQATPPAESRQHCDAGPSDGGRRD